MHRTAALYKWSGPQVFTAWSYASAVSVRPLVCLSVWLSEAGTVPKPLNEVSECILNGTIMQHKVGYSVPVKVKTNTIDKT